MNDDDDGAPSALAVANRREWRDAVWSSDLSPIDRLVALAYAEHAAADPGRVWVTSERLQAMTGAARSTTQTALRRLEASGWLAVTEPARQHYATRYALTIPGPQLVAEDAPEPRVTEEPAPIQRPDTRAPETPGNRAPDTQRPDTRAPQGPGSRAPEHPGARLPTPGAREPGPNQNHNQQRMHAGPPNGTTTDAAAPWTSTLASAPLVGTAAAIASTIRGHRLGRHLPADVIAEHAHALAAARYDARAIEEALSLEDFTSARGAGLLRHALVKLSRTPLPGPAPAPTGSHRCERHGTTYATFCGSCMADVRAGDLDPWDAAGDLPAPFHTRTAIPA